MDRLIIVGLVLIVAAAIAVVVSRRRPPPPVRTGYDLPDHLDRADFDRPDAPWLVAVFTAATCAGCADSMTKAALLDGDEVAVQEVEESAERDLHRRYRIEAVPMIVIVDSDGRRRAGFLGPTKADELWATMAGLRDA